MPDKEPEGQTKGLSIEELMELVPFRTFNVDVDAFKFDELSLKILDLVDGNRKIDEIVEQTGEQRLRVLAWLKMLRNGGIIDVPTRCQNDRISRPPRFTGEFGYAPQPEKAQPDTPKDERVDDTSPQAETAAQSATTLSTAACSQPATRLGWRNWPPPRSGTCRCPQNRCSLHCLAAALR